MMEKFMAGLCGKDRLTGKTVSINCNCGFNGVVELNKFEIGLGHVWCPECHEKFWLTMEECI